MSTSAEPGASRPWVVPDPPVLPDELVAAAARSQASLGPGLEALRALRFGFLAPATPDVARRWIDAGGRDERPSG